MCPVLIIGETCACPQKCIDGRAGECEWEETLGECCNSELDSRDRLCECYEPRSGKTMVGNEDETTDKRVIHVLRKFGCWWREERLVEFGLL